MAPADKKEKELESTVASALQKEANVSQIVECFVLIALQQVDNLTALNLVSMVIMSLSSWPSKSKH